MSNDTTDWLRIEREAHDQVVGELAMLVDTPLVFGQHIAWTDCRFGRTDDLSSVHRVGFPKGNDPHTTCGELIPHPVRWFPLSPALIQTMQPCRFCEAEYARAPQREHAA
jgi:hypothetical protein